jgi:hypothetical protein
MKKTFILLFILGLSVSTVSFASEDQSGGDCKYKNQTSLSKEEIIDLKGASETVVETAVDISEQ